MKWWISRQFGTTPPAGNKLFPHDNRERKYLLSEWLTRVNSLPAEPKYFSSVLHFKGVINSSDLTQFVSLGFLVFLLLTRSDRELFSLFILTLFLTFFKIPYSISKYGYTY